MDKTLIQYLRFTQSPDLMISHAFGPADILFFCQYTQAKGEGYIWQLCEIWSNVVRKDHARIGLIFEILSIYLYCYTIRFSLNNITNVTIYRSA